MIQTLAATARLAALAVGLSAAPLAGATTFNTSDLETHGRWHSVTLTLGEERHFRALEQYSYSDTLLSLNFTPGSATCRGWRFASSSTSIRPRVGWPTWSRPTCGSITTPSITAWRSSSPSAVTAASM